MDDARTIGTVYMLRNSSFFWQKLSTLIIDETYNGQYSVQAGHYHSGDVHASILFHFLSVEQAV